MATLKQVAQRAGVSRRTVDRVLNQRGSVKLETAERVRSALRELNYCPDETGQVLAAKKRKLRLAFCSIKGETALLHEEIRQGAMKKAMDLEKLGVTVDFYTIDRKTPLEQEEAKKLVAEFNCDGMAAVGQEEPIIQQMIEKAIELHIPIVFYNIDDEQVQRSCYVGCDYKKSGRIAAGLLGLCDSKSRVGIFTVGGSPKAFHSPNYQGRVEGFLEEIEERYPQIELTGQYLLPRDILDCYDIVTEVLNREQEMNAVYLVNPGDYSACRAIKKVAGSRKIRIITNDTTKEAVALLQEGILTATISQDPESQGILPLQILYELLVFGRLPKQKKYYTELRICIPQNFMP